MNNYSSKQVDIINFKGKYRQYDVDGNPYNYVIGDCVDYNGQLYVAIQNSRTKIPGTQEGKSFWNEFGGKFGFFVQETAPQNADVGNRWYVPSTAIMYTFVREKSNKFWVEL